MDARTRGEEEEDAKTKKLVRPWRLSCLGDIEVGSVVFFFQSQALDLLRTPTFLHNG
jgi:hypothetical protein